LYYKIPMFDAHVMNFAVLVNSMTFGNVQHFFKRRPLIKQHEVAYDSYEVCIPFVSIELKRDGVKKMSCSKTSE
jgi:hypothetical protein